MNPLELVSKTLFSFGEKELTKELLDAFGKRAESFEQYNDVAKILFELKVLPKAIEYGERALQLAKTPEERYVTSKNLINAYTQSNLPEKAMTQIQKCKKVHPLDPELLFEETTCYSQLGQHDKAHDLLFELLNMCDIPKEIEKKARHNLSGYYFRKDDLRTALFYFLPETEKEAYRHVKMNIQKWDGKLEGCQTLIIDANCGAGDEIMHVRFMSRLRELGIRPIWSTTRRDISEVFNYNGFESVCVWDSPLYPENSQWVYALSLPYHLGLTCEELGQKPYLKPLPSKQSQYDYLNQDRGPKIGIFWNSDSGFEQAHFRSVDFKSLWNVVKSDRYSVYSLQMSDNPVPDFCKGCITEFHSPDRNFTDTFSIVNHMDLVVTSCTSIAHIAAAMGKKVCIFVPIMEYYAWTSSTGKSWWYGDNVQLFRQKTPRDWGKPLKQLNEYLNEL